MDDRFSPQPLGTPLSVADDVDDAIPVSGTGPLYEVVLRHTGAHSPEYVMALLQQLFGHTPAQGQCVVQHLEEKGQAILAVTYRDDAERRRRLIQSFGPDPRVAHSTGPMWVLIRAALCS